MTKVTRRMPEYFLVNISCGWIELSTSVAERIFNDGASVDHNQPGKIASKCNALFMIEREELEAVVIAAPVANYSPKLPWISRSRQKETQARHLSVFQFGGQQDPDSGFGQIFTPPLDLLK
jgi:propanediol utilization protein